MPRPRSGDWLEDEIRNFLDAGLGVVIHCRTGVGRSALIAACVLQRQGVPITAVNEVIPTVL